MGLLNISGQSPIDAPGKDVRISGRECSKKHALSLSEGSIQQGRSPFDARSVLSVREHGKRARTPLAAFFNIPLMAIGDSEHKRCRWGRGSKNFNGKIEEHKHEGRSYYASNFLLTYLVSLLVFRVMSITMSSASFSRAVRICSKSTLAGGTSSASARKSRSPDMGALSMTVRSS